MRRRHFLASAAGVGFAMPALSALPKGHILELRHYHLRNNSDQQMAGITAFLKTHALPASQRAGVLTQGAFANLIGGAGPFVILLNSYPSLAAMEASTQKLAEDKLFQKALDEYYAKPGLSYVRVESTLLRGFDSMPAIEAPPLEVAEGKTHIFELRTYASDDNATLRSKIKMFESGEIGIFKRLGMRPVFFGSALAGANMPNLTYMLCYDNLAHREKVWQSFGADTEWAKLRATPGWSDAEIVSGITNTMLRPLPFSPIR